MDDIVCIGVVWIEVMLKLGHFSPPPLPSVVFFQINMSKRSAAAISQEDDTPPTAPPPGLPDFANAPPVGHHIKQTIIGPICTHPKCNNQKVAKTNSLFIVTDETIRTHWRKNGCCNKESKPNASELVRQLKTQIVGIHHRMSRNPVSVDELINEYFPPTAEEKPFNTGYCSRCGFNAKPSKVKTNHIASPKTKCTMLDFNAKGLIYTSPSGYKIPKAILEKIASGTFTLPFVEGNQSPSIASNATATANTVVATMANTATPNTPTTPTATPNPTTIFGASMTEMTAASSVAHVATATQEKDHVVEQLRQCFGGESIVIAMGHMATFLHLAKQGECLAASLVSMSRKLIPPAAGECFELRLLTESGKLWLQSEAANMDVYMLSPDIRNQVYIIGSHVPSASRDLGRGTTFVASSTSEINDMISEFTSLITFAYNSGWGGMQLHRTQASDIYSSLPE